MRWQRVLIWSGFGLLTFIAVAISWLLLADLGVLKPRIERWASEATGRTVAINGELHIDLAKHSSVIVEELHISNADWADEPEMVSVGRLEVRLELFSLFRGPLVIELIDLDDTRVALASPETGPPNWVLVQTGKKDAETAEAGRAVRVQQLDIDNVAVSYISPARTRPMRLNIDSAVQQVRQDDFLELSFAGTLNDREIQLDGEIGSWSDLLAGRNVRFDLGARVDSFVVNAEGEIDELLQPIRPRITFEASAPDVNDLLRALNVDQKGKGDINLSGSLMPMERGPLVLDVDGRVGRLDVDASGEFSDLRHLQEFELDVLASGEDIRPILEAIGAPQTRASPFMVKINATRSGPTFIVNEANMVFGEAKLELAARLPEFPRIDDSVIKLQIDGPDIERFRQLINLPGAATGPFSVGVTVDTAGDGFELLDINVRTSLGELRADGRLGDAPEFYETTLNFGVYTHSIGAVAAAYGVARMPDKPVEISGSARISPDGIRTVGPLSLTADEVTAEFEGLIKPVRGLLGSDFAFVLNGPDLAELIGEFTNGAAVPGQPYNLAGQLQVREDGYRLRGVNGKLGTSDLALDGLLVPRRRIVGSRFEISAKGNTFSELVDQFENIDVRPGPYELSGGIEFQPESIVFKKVELDRAAGNIDLDLELGLPVARRTANFELRASGPNVQSLLSRFEGFAAAELPFLIDLDGSVDGSAWLFDQLDVQVGLAQLSASGGLNLAGDAAASRFGINVEVPDLAPLGTVGGRRLRSQRFNLDGNVTGSNGELRVDDLNVQLGDSDIRGKLGLVAGEVPRIDLKIASDAMNFKSVLEDKPANLETALDDGRLIPDIEIPFQAMAKIDGSIDIEARVFQRNEIKLRNVVVQAELQGGRLDLNDLRFHAPAGALAARGYLDPRDDDGAAGVELVAREFALGMRELNQDLAMTSDIDINLEGTGTDLRSLLGNASGVLYYDARGGRVKEIPALRALWGNALHEIVGTINPFSKTEEYTQFDCIILPLEINAGILIGNPSSLIATSKIQIVTKSQVNLRSEKIEVNMKTTPKQGLSISAGDIVNPYIKVEGTLARPRLAVDEKGVLLSGGAAFATGGLSVLAQAAWSRLARAKDPCSQAAAEGKEMLGGRFPDLEVPVPLPKSPSAASTPGE